MIQIRDHPRLRPARHFGPDSPSSLKPTPDNGHAGMQAGRRATNLARHWPRAWSVHPSDVRRKSDVASQMASMWRNV